jgi:hypothetical protein
VTTPTGGGAASMRLLPSRCQTIKNRPILYYIHRKRLRKWSFSLVIDNGEVVDETTARTDHYNERNKQVTGQIDNVTVERK